MGRDARPMPARHGSAMRAIDIEQFAGDLVQIGTVATVDVAAATCTVAIGDLETGDLPWLAARAGAVRLWSPPTVGEQVLLLAPDGDLANGVVLAGIWSDAFPPPSASADLLLAAFADGANLSYDQAAHVLSATLPAGATVSITAPGGVTITADSGVAITGDVSISGDVTVTGTLTADTDVVGGGKSLKGHKHGGVAAGGAQSGPPV